MNKSPCSDLLHRPPRVFSYKSTKTFYRTNSTTYLKLAFPSDYHVWRGGGGGGGANLNGGGSSRAARLGYSRSGPTSQGEPEVPPLPAAPFPDVHLCK